MDVIDLELALTRPLCTKCGKGRIRPIAIESGQCLSLNCPSCHWRGRSELPDIKKKVIYLDTSVVSNLATIYQEEGANSPWMKLYQALRQATGDDVIYCAISSVVEQEISLSRRSAEIARMCGELGGPNLVHSLDIQYAQLFRALDRFLADSEPVLELPPRKDAFAQLIDQWTPSLQIEIEKPYLPDQAQRLRDKKNNIHLSVKKIYAQHGEQKTRFREIYLAEAKGFGEGIIKNGQLVIEQRLQALSGGKVINPLDLLSTTFDHIAEEIRLKQLLSCEDARKRAIVFLRSEHVSRMPLADLYGKLYAAIAVSTQGETPRNPLPSDSDDVAHVATFVPYVDIFTADGFCAALCNRPDLRLGDRYGTQIRTLAVREIDSFVDEIEKLRASSPQASLAHRIYEAINEGGYIKEQEARLRRYIQGRSSEKGDIRND